MTNRGVRINTAVGGRLLVNTERGIEDAVGGVVDRYYQLRDAAVRHRVVGRPAAGQKSDRRAENCDFPQAPLVAGVPIFVGSGSGPNGRNRLL